MAEQPKRPKAPRVEKAPETGAGPEQVPAQGPTPDGPAAAPDGPPAGPFPPRVFGFYTPLDPAWVKGEEGAAIMADYDARWRALTRPFPPEDIETLPKPYQRGAPKGNCRECGGYHGLPAVHLSYVGHAGITTRLNEVDPLWQWEPVARDDHGLPLLDANGSLWIKLTVLGHTRLGVGDADGKRGAMATKEVIGDALRNAAMRFGVGTYLWSKSDRAAALTEGAAENVPVIPTAQEQSGPAVTPEQAVDAIGDAARILGKTVEDVTAKFRAKHGNDDLTSYPVAMLIEFRRELEPWVRAAQEKADRDERDAEAQREAEEQHG